MKTPGRRWRYYGQFVTCAATGKRGWLDKKSARKVYKLQSTRDGDRGLRVFSCDYCNCYHVGHSKVKTQGKESLR